MGALSRLQAVIFDMDGLLVDTEVIYRDAMIEATEEFGQQMPPWLFLSMIGTVGPVSEQKIIDHFGPDFPVEAWTHAVRTRAGAMIKAGVQLKAGVVELLDDLDALGLPRAIATSSSHEGVELHLSASGIIPRFQAIVARGDYARGKPYPDPFLKAAECLDVPAGACLALEDSHNGVRAAAAAGMMTVMVPDLLEATDEMRGLCHSIAADLHEARDLVRALARRA